jgi:hypothetical protein
LPTRDGKLVCFTPTLFLAYPAAKVERFVYRRSSRADNTPVLTRKQVARLNYDQLPTTDGEPIPTLEQAIEQFPDMRFFVDPKTDDAIEPLVETILKTGAMDRVAIDSFSGQRNRKVVEKLEAVTNKKAACMVALGQGAILTLLTFYANFTGRSQDEQRVKDYIANIGATSSHTVRWLSPRSIGIVKDMTGLPLVGSSFSNKRLSHYEMRQLASKGYDGLHSPQLELASHVGRQRARSNTPDNPFTRAE